jgi:hypothetical protein
MAGRHARCGELWLRAVAAAEAASWPPASLALARLRLEAHCALSRAHEAAEHADGGAASGFVVPMEGPPLQVLLQAVDTLLERDAAGTLLRCTPAENAFLRDLAAATAPKALQASAFARALLAAAGETTTEHSVGYLAALLAADRLSMMLASLTNLTVVLALAAEAGADAADNGDAPRVAPPDARQMALLLSYFERSLVRLLGLIPRVRGAAREGALLPPAQLFAEENDCTHQVEAVLAALDHVAPRLHVVKGADVGMVARLHAAWAPCVAAFDAGALAAARRTAEACMRSMDARARADRAGWAPRTCASCDVTEPHPQAFKLCSACRGVAYCSAEHQKAHWRAGHKAACAGKGKKGAAAGAGAGGATAK